MIELFSFPFSAMGTDCNLHFYSESPALAEELSGLAIAEVYRIEDRYSRYNPKSFLSEINRIAAAGGKITVDAETAELLDFAFNCFLKSGRLFDISSGILRKAWGDFSSGILPSGETIKDLLPRTGMDKISWKSPTLEFLTAGMDLDFGGIGKEYASDRAAEVLASRGIKHGLVDLGGDINIFGPHPGNDPWLIGIREPRKPGEIMGNVEVSKGSLATSGDYERCMVIDGVRYGHIINPLTGWPVRGLASVSVITDNCLEAGSLCTIAMLKGAEGAAWLAGSGARHLWVDENGARGGPIVLLPE